MFPSPSPSPYSSSSFITNSVYNVCTNGNKRPMHPCPFNTTCSASTTLQQQHEPDTRHTPQANIQTQGKCPRGSAAYNGVQPSIHILLRQHFFSKRSCMFLLRNSLNTFTHAHNPRFLISSAKQTKSTHQNSVLTFISGSEGWSRWWWWWWWSRGSHQGCH